jgi:hypothetical protein
MTNITDEKPHPSKRQQRQAVEAAQIYTTPPTFDDVPTQPMQQLILDFSSVSLNR